MISNLVFDDIYDVKYIKNYYGDEVKKIIFFLKIFEYYYM